MTALGGTIWTLGLAINIGSKSSRDVLEFTSRLGLYFLQVSFLVRSLSLATLAVVVFLTIKHGSTRLQTRYLIIAILLQWTVILLPLTVRLPRETLTEPIYVDEYYYLPYMKLYGKLIQLALGVVLEIVAKAVTFTFVTLAFYYVKHNTDRGQNCIGAPNKAMLKFLLIFVAINMLTTFLSLVSIVGAVVEPEDFPVDALLVSVYVINAVMSTATMCVTVMVLVQFKSTMKTLRKACCHKQPETKPLGSTCPTSVQVEGQEITH